MMKTPKLFVAVACLALAGFATSVYAGPQVGIGPAIIFGDDDTSLGIDLEAGFSSRTQDVQAFFGANVLYAGLDKDLFANGFNTSADVDYWVLQGIFRLLIPVTADGSLKVYGEGGLGGTYVNAQLDRVSSKVQDWVFTYSLGAGLDYSFNEIVGLRAGYHFIGMDQVRGFNTDVSESHLSVIKVGLIMRF